MNKKRRIAACVRGCMRRVTAAGMAVVMLVMLGATLGLLSNPVTAQAASKQTGIVTIGTTNLRIRSSTDTSNNNNVITRVNGGFQLDILDKVSTSDTYDWYHVGFYLNGTYTYGYVTSQYVTITSDDADPGYSSDQDFEKYLTSQGFPESYKEGLRKLHAKYPKWVFVADHTGKTWNEVVEAENKLGRSLIYGSAMSSWKSTVDGAYNWETGVWHEYDSGGWVQASSELVQYALDPRNFLNETNVFMFESLAFNSSIHSQSGVSNVISGTFMQSSGHDLGYNGTSYNYASGLMLAGSNSGVSPYHLATRIIQEQGSQGTGSSISGTVSGYSGIYNYYNQGAYKTASAGAIENGLIFSSRTDAATLRPWNTRMKSIIGGAIYIGSQYINRGQNTIYYEKFDLVSPYWHQYMTNILAARSESQTASKAYSDTAKQNTALIFKIPVYNNMPASACAIPSGDGSPNNRLNSLSVDGYGITPSFQMNTTSYDVIVPYNTSSVRINAGTVDGNARVDGAGTHNLQVGSNQIKVTVTAQNGSKKVYSLNVVRKEGSQSGGGSQSGSGFTTDYQVNNDTKTLTKVGVGSQASDVLSKISYTNGAYGKVLNADGSENQGTVATGSQLVVYQSDGKELSRYTFVIYGDLNGDGVVDVYDLIYMRRHLLDISKLTGAYAQAADTNRGNDGIDVYDLIYLRRHLLDIEYIKQ